LDYPLLVRLNPNVPFKTRGNGAIVLRLKIDENVDLNDIIELVKNIVEKYCDMKHPKTDPGIAVLVGEISSELTKIYYRALTEIVPIS